MRMYVRGVPVDVEGGTEVFAGDGINIEDGVVNVSTPVKGVTQAEYDGIPEEERKGLYVVTDANTALPDGGDVYFTEETRIGTWIDGKPLYRSCVFYNIRTSAERNIIDVDKIDIRTIDRLINQYGSCAINNNDICTVGNIYITLVISNGVLYLDQRFSSTAPHVYSGYIVIEYTKTTDQGVNT